MDTDKANIAGHEVKGDIKVAAGITTDMDRDPAGKAEKGQRTAVDQDDDFDDGKDDGLDGDMSAMPQE